MTENEKTLRKVISWHIGQPGIATLDALLADVRQSARDAALEEACANCEQEAEDWRNRNNYTAGTGAAYCAQRVNWLKSQPARRYHLDAEEVREEVALPLLRAFALMEVGSYVWSVTRDVLDGFRRIGLDLDAAPKPTQPREYATVENGLLPAPRKP